MHIIIYILHTVSVSLMQSESAQPTPNDQFNFDMLPNFENLSASDRQSTYSELDESSKLPYHNSKTKIICKQFEKCQAFKKPNSNNKAKRQNHQKKIRFLQRKIDDLEKQLVTLKRKYQFCPHCRLPIVEEVNPKKYTPFESEQICNLAGQLDSRRNSRQSVEFEKIDFSSNLMFNTQMDGKAWIYLGSMMIAMGSTVMQIDGTFNIFRIVKQAGDLIRRQIEKSQTRINLDIFSLKEEMKEPMIDGLQFDPFCEKSYRSGFELDGIKLQSVEQFQLIYEQKLNFSVNYESLLTAFEYLRGHCSVSF